MDIRDIVDLCAWFGRRKKLLDAVDEAEWLPHFVTPINLVEKFANDTAALDASLTRYYADEWPSVSSILLDQVRAYNLNQETKSTFAEAVANHGDGRFRSVVRLLLPEIERLIRVETGDQFDHRIIQKFQDAIPRLTLFGLIPDTGIEAMHISRLLTDHLYENVRSVDALDPFKDHGVPNRHASIHGLISYRTQKQSLNAIFMTDFVMLLLDLAKRRTA